MLYVNNTHGTWKTEDQRMKQIINNLNINYILKFNILHIFGKINFASLFHFLCDY